MRLYNLILLYVLSIPSPFLYCSLHAYDFSTGFLSGVRMAK